LKAEEKDKAKLKDQRDSIKIVVSNLKARAEKIENLKLEEKWLKEDIKKGGNSAWGIMNRKGYKPKEFW